MTSHILKRTLRVAIAAAAIAATVGLVSGPATADPTPTSSSDALHQFKQLSSQAEKLNEDYLKAKTDLQAKQAELTKANSDFAHAQQAEKQAKSQESQFRGKVDQLSDASYQGARFNKLSALLTGESPQDFLNRASALQLLASDNYTVLHKLANATNQAQSAQAQAQGAQQRAQAATNAANQLITDIKHRNTALQQQISQVKAALNKLSGADRATLANPGDTGVFIGPPGAAGTAMDFALSQRGKPYVWGADGPSSYDCSGLTMTAYRQAGVSLPHSAAAQSEMGQSVSRGNLQPGDLVFFGSPAHHVGIYVGGGKMVDAPNSGEVVRVEPLQSDYSGARRIAG
ncbi:MAG: NlpC/P60 family protein [Sciscionella sp.]